MTDEIGKRARRYAALNDFKPGELLAMEPQKPSSIDEGYSALEIGLGAIGLAVGTILFVAISSWQQPMAACEGAGTPPAPSHLKQDRLAVPS